MVLTCISNSSGSGCFSAPANEGSATGAGLASTQSVLVSPDTSVPCAAQPVYTDLSACLLSAAFAAPSCQFPSSVPAFHTESPQPPCAVPFCPDSPQPPCAVPSCSDSPQPPCAVPSCSDSPQPLCTASSWTGFSQPAGSSTAAGASSTGSNRWSYFSCWLADKG